ncbi:glycosyltransferase [Tundrisphaera sp. TA3]|uniref:glycosyltransferase n=1 Tax=Tundrisphaera sp. TA3 TaxID=3435775 RepID=UPI003EBDB7D9
MVARVETVLNVLQVIPTLDRSGAEKQMALLATGLPRDRFRVEVAALTRSGPLAADLASAGIPVTTIGKRLKLDPFALAKLARLVKKGRFDVVHTWIFAADVYGRVAARMAGVPVVITSEMAVDLWKSRRELAVDRWLAKHTDRVVGNSEAVVDFYREAGIPPERLTMIASGIGDEEPPAIDRAAVRASLGLPLDAPLILYAGRLAEQKGVGDLIAALDLLQHVRPDLRTLIVGDGPLRGKLVSMAHAFKLDVDHKVRFLGHREDVPTLLACADLLVLPSLYEGLPNVVLEAMRFRVPVVATAAPGTTELIVDGQTGLLVPVRNPPLLAQAMRRVIEEPGLGRRLAEAGRTRVETSFGASRMIGSFADLYEEIARAKDRPVH